MVRLSLVALTAITCVSHAWMPNDGSKKLLDRRGFSLFERQNTAAAEGADLDKRWWSASAKLRGVNLGSLFVFEPWMQYNLWKNMGCEGQESEFDCVKNTGQERANAAFQNHWNTFITEADFDEMVSYDINTVRIPLGYWLDESLIDAKSEYFPRGALPYLIKICGWASDRGIYIILDHHGAPGAQTPRNSFTGQFAPSVGFYNDYNYDRAVKFLQFLTKLAHTTPELRNVGMIEVLNEPTNWGDSVQSLRSNFYKNSYDAIRQVEMDLGITPNNFYHIQMMGSNWGSGDPTEWLSNTYFTSFDDHRYLKWDTSVETSHEAYISKSCSDNRSGDVEGPTIVGEWSLGVPDALEWTDEWIPHKNIEFYKSWFAAQASAYEKYAAGWVFWSWKVDGNSRWSYKDLVLEGIIPRDLDTISVAGIC